MSPLWELKWLFRFVWRCRNCWIVWDGDRLGRSGLQFLLLATQIQCTWQECTCTTLYNSRRMGSHLVYSLRCPISFMFIELFSLELNKIKWKICTSRTEMNENHLFFFLHLFLVECIPLILFSVFLVFVPFWWLVIRKSIPFTALQQIRHKQEWDEMESIIIASYDDI